MKIRMLNGYRVVYKPSSLHAMKSKNWNGFVYEHIDVVSEHLGRELQKGEVIHHLDEDKSNNNIKNLLLLSNSQHSKLHRWLESVMVIKKPVEVKYCVFCGTVLVRQQIRYCSNACRNKHQQLSSKMPSAEILKEELKSMSREAIGRKYGVTGSGIKKVAKKYGLI